MKTLGERLKYAREQMNLSQQDVANRTGMSQPTYYKIESGKSKRTTYLNELSKVLNVRADWLATGEGQMHAHQKDLDCLVETNDFDERNTIPVVSWVAAGSWTECQSVTLDDVLEELPRPMMMHDKCFALKVRGESMLPDFKPDEYIYVDPNYGFFDLKNGDLVVVLEVDKNEATFKQLVIGETSDDMYLRPLNPHWHEQKMLPKSEWQLIGKVIGKWVKF